MPSRSMRSLIQIALMCGGKYIVSSVAGHAELAALNSLMLLTWVLLNGGSHCITLRTPNSERPSVTDNIAFSSFLRPL